MVQHMAQGTLHSFNGTVFSPVQKQSSAPADAAAADSPPFSTLYSLAIFAQVFLCNVVEIVTKQFSIFTCDSGGGSARFAVLFCSVQFCSLRVMPIPLTVS